METIEEIKKALAIAADALKIVGGWVLFPIQVNPPTEWELDGGGEDPSDGLCSIMALSDKLREFAS